jgi:hypothetical protein
MTTPGNDRQSRDHQNAKAKFRAAALYDPRPTSGFVLDNLVYERAPGPQAGKEAEREAEAEAS